jgi:hypothetical protein
MATQAEKIEGASLVDAQARFEAEGYLAQFGARPGCAVVCFACREESPAQDIVLHSSYRVEGPSDPGSEAVVNAVVCPKCGAKGTLTLTYGPMAPAEDAEVFACLHDERREALLTTPAGGDSPA